MGSLNDVFELIDRQQQDGQEVLNVYFYRQDAILVGNAAQMCVDAFITEVLPSITDIQTNNVVHTEISARNLYNDSESWSELISEPGASPADTMPTFNAIPFRLIGDNSAVRDGQKRYAGVDEGAATDGVIDNAGFLLLLATLAAALIDPLGVGLEATAFIPVIVKRILVSPGNYRLPNSQAEDTISNIVDALFNVEVTSQTSRKIGVGA